MRILLIYGKDGIVLPCGDGRNTIQELASIAALRYKNMFKGSDIVVYRLSLLPSECMLDWSDRICDVLDNLDKVKVLFESEISKENEETVTDPECCDVTEIIQSHVLGNESDSHITSFVLDGSNTSVSEFGVPTPPEVEGSWRQYLETMNIASIKTENVNEISNCVDNSASFVTLPEPAITSPVKGKAFRYDCPKCGKWFTNLYNATKHKRVHDDKSYKCDICDKILSSSSSLRSHKFTHSGLKPFKCDVCQLSFTKSFSVRRHKRIHDKENNY